MEETSASTLAAFKANSLRESCLGSITLKSPRFAQVKWAPRLVRLVNKHLYRLGIGGVLNRYDSSITFYSARSDRKLYAGFPGEAIFCNFGSGAFQHPRWVNYDYPGASSYYQTIQGKPGRDFHPIDLCADGLRLPYDNNSVSLIYCSHTLEHLEEGKAFHFLKECARILKPGGTMRIAVPNTDNDFDFCRAIFFQEHIGDAEKKVSARFCASHVFTPSNALPDEVLLEDLLACDFSAEGFVRLATEKRGLSRQFDGRNPEFHLTHWNHRKFARLAREFGFNYYVPLYRGSTLASPFRNIEVFDNTEPHVSLYGELVGAETV